MRAIAERVAERPASHWLGVLDAAGVPCGAVRSVQEAMHMVAVSPVTGVAPATRGSVRFAPPGLDEHGPVIRAHGWDAFAHVRPVSPER